MREKIDRINIVSFFYNFSMGLWLLSGLVVLLTSLAPDLQAATTVKITKQGGVYTIPCKINGLALRFILDTGASDVSIPINVARFMFKNGYLTTNDIIGAENYLLAGGQIQQGTVIVFREIVIGNITLNDVRASVVYSPSAPLLLGQSALQKLGSVNFDYTTGTVTFGGNVSNSNIAVNPYRPLNTSLPPSVTTASVSGLTLSELLKRYSYGNSWIALLLTGESKPNAPSWLSGQKWIVIAQSRYIPW